MFAPGAYRPEPSEGITTPAELPPPELIRYYRSDTRQPCPRCGHWAYRDKEHHRTLHAIQQKSPCGHFGKFSPLLTQLLQLRLRSVQ